MGIDDVVRGFSLAGVLDEDSKARERWPIVEVDPRELLDHPENAVYSMDDEGIAELADSIWEDGLTDIPLARRLEDGRLQLISGHRRKAAWITLMDYDSSMAKMPVRVIDGVDDEKAVVMLHAANFFSRELTVTERAAATKALEPLVRRMREADPSLKGMRTEDIKAAVISAQTGHELSGKTVRRAESAARKIEDRLADCWKADAKAGVLGVTDIQRLAKLPEETQIRVKATCETKMLGKRDVSKAIREAGIKEPANGNNLLLRAVVAFETLAGMIQVPKLDPMLWDRMEKAYAEVKRRQ